MIEIIFCFKILMINLSTFWVKCNEKNNSKNLKKRLVYTKFNFLDMYFLEIFSKTKIEALETYK